MTRKILLAGFTAALVLGAANRVQENKLQQAIDLMETRGDLPAAVRLFEEVAGSGERNLAARALLYLGSCHQKLGDAKARQLFERVLREFGDQTEAVAEARTRLASLGRSAPSSGGIVTRQVWAGKKVDASGTVSPDGRYLSFVDWETGDLAIRDLVSGTDRRLTRKGTWAKSDEFAEESTISRDGKGIAYGWFNGNDRYEIRMIELGGGQPRRLLDNPDIDWAAPYDWSPDGKWIAVQISRKDGTAQIGLLDSVGGALRVLKSVDWRGTGRMYFSPDGKYLAYDLPASDMTSKRRLRAGD